MTFEELCTFEVLYAAFLTARKGKREKWGTLQYEADVLVMTVRLSRRLAAGTYRPSRFEIFVIFEPKKRLIQAPAFVDKVLLHAIVDNFLYEAITKSFILDNYASQNNKGMLEGLSRLKRDMVEYYRKTGSADGWVLKGDVRHFFASIDHDRLKAKLKKLFTKRGLDPRIFALLCVYIDASDGLPLGYQTSQLFALLFLDEFDHLIQERYRFRWYGRYMDDFFIIARTKKELQALLVEVRSYMAGCGLELNEKTCIHPLRNGIDFLGFHSYLTDTGACVQKLRHANVERIRARIAYWRTAYPEGKVTAQEIKDSFGGWDAHAAFGDTYSLRRKYADQVEEIIGEKITIHRKINSTRQARENRKNRQRRKYNKKHQPKED